LEEQYLLNSSLQPHVAPQAAEVRDHLVSGEPALQLMTLLEHGPHLQDVAMGNHLVGSGSPVRLVTPLEDPPHPQQVAMGDHLVGGVP
jgi:hypothetical protein